MNDMPDLISKIGVSKVSWFVLGLFLIALAILFAKPLVDLQVESVEEELSAEQPIYHKKSPAPGQTEDVSGWKTYRNEEYGFEFRYPPDWENPVERNGAISFGVATPDDYEEMKLLINIVSNGSKTLDQVISEYDSGYGVSVNDIEMATLDGTEAKKFIEYRQGGFTAFGLFAIHDNYIYKIWYGNRQGGVPIPPTVPQVQRILSTFKFIEPS